LFTTGKEKSKHQYQIYGSPGVPSDYLANNHSSTPPPTYT